MVSPASRRELVDWAKDGFQLTERRACRAVSVGRSMIRYASVKAPDAPLRARLHELARDRLTFGYPRLHVLLTREGWTVHRTRVYRLYREEGLSLTRTRPRRRKAAMLRPVRPTTVAANQRWAMDFMHDVLASGQKIRVFTLVDVHTRECLTLRAQRSFRGEDVASILSEVGGARAALPEVIQVDNGTEFTSTALDHWAYWNHVQLDCSRPAKPVDNCIVEAFNGSLRRECVTQHWFASLTEAQLLLREWQEDYNTVRPHQSLANEPPATYAATAAGGHFTPNRLRLKN